MSPEIAMVLSKFRRWVQRYVNPPVYRFFHPLPSRELSISRVYLIFALMVFLFNEYLCFWWAFLQWPNLASIMRAPDADHLRVLFVADPQIVGMENENHFFGPVTRWDSDKYLLKSYSLAMGYVRPDAVIFLGDLIDEGSIATDADFRHYVKRFHRLFPIPSNVKVAYLPGDNDIGGEGRDQYSLEKQKRFESHFGEFTGIPFTVKFVDFVPIRFNYLEAFDVTGNEPLAEQLASPIRVVLNHFTMLRCKASRHLLKRAPLHVMNLFRSSLAFTGDIHKARHDSALVAEQIESCQSTPLGAARNLTSFRLAPDTWHEIVTPTCSYRMGVSHMGFTVATIGRDGQVDVAFLWLPGRFGYLFLYLFLLIFAVVQFIYFRCGMGKERLKPMTP